MNKKRWSSTQHKLYKKTYEIQKTLKTCWRYVDRKIHKNEKQQAQMNAKTNDAFKKNYYKISGKMVLGRNGISSKKTNRINYL